MALQLGDTAPDFTAETTEGTVSLHACLGDSWIVGVSVDSVASLKPYLRLTPQPNR